MLRFELRIVVREYQWAKSITISALYSTTCARGIYLARRDRDNLVIKIRTNGMFLQ